VTFPEIDAAAQTPAGQTRLKRQLAEQSIALATAADWAEAAETNRRLLELGPDSEAENRLAKALWELGELGAAREHYQKALALDPTNRIAERNIDRLKVLLVEAGEKTVSAKPGSKAPVSIFVEETGKTGFAHLTNLARASELAQVNPGDAVELTPEGNRLIAISNGVRIGVVEPRVAARLLKLMADGNKYLAGVTSLATRTSADPPRGVPGPAQLRQGELPTAAKSTDPGPTPRHAGAEEEELEDDSRTTSRTRRSRTSIASCRRRRRRTRRSSRRPTSRGAVEAPTRRPTAAAGPSSPSATIRRWPAEPCSCVPNRVQPPRVRALRAAAPRRSSPRASSPSGPGDIVLTPSGVAAGWHARRSTTSATRSASRTSPRTGCWPRSSCGAGPPPPGRRGPGAGGQRPPGVQPQGVDRRPVATRCATCDRPVTLDEVTWAVDATTRTAGNRAAPVATLPLHSVPDQLGGASPPGPLDPGTWPPRRPDAPRRASGSGPVPGARRRGRAAGRAARPPHPPPAGRLAAILSASRTTFARRDRAAPCGSRSSMRSARPAGSRRRPARRRRSGSPPATSSCPRGLTSASATRGSRSRTGCARCAASSSASGERRRGDRSRTPGRRPRSLVEGSATAVVKLATPATFGALQLEPSTFGILAATAGAARAGLTAAATRRGAACLGLPRDGLGAGSRRGRPAAAGALFGPACDRRGAGRRRPSPDRCGAWSPCSPATRAWS